jgi:ring-1,2-phenylacetyl-CoA epoxidase subunit PaaE
MLKFHELEIAELRPETARAVCIRFAVPDELRDEFAYLPGQHVTLEAEIDGKRVRRPYSICSSVDDRALRVAIKRHPDGRFSAFANTSLAAGHRVRVMTPTGHFVASPEPESGRTHVAFAAGSGITPILSIVKTLLEREPLGQVILFYGNRSPEDVMFRSELADLKDCYLDRFSLYHVLSGPEQEVALLSGRIDAKRCRELVDGFCVADRVDQWYVCGPGSMIDDVRATLSELRVPADRIHFERFRSAKTAPPARRRPAAAQPGAATITAIFDGRRQTFSIADGDETLLEAGLRHGLELPFSCRGGVCATCRARVVEGQVEMDVNHALEPWELEAGFVLTCQARPRSESITVDYDQV